MPLKSQWEIESFRLERRLSRVGVITDTQTSHLRARLDPVPTSGPCDETVDAVRCRINTRSYTVGG